MNPDNTDQTDSIDVEGNIVNDPDCEDGIGEYNLTNVVVTDGAVMCPIKR